MHNPLTTSWLDGILATLFTDPQVGDVIDVPVPDGDAYKKQRSLRDRLRTQFDYTHTYEQWFVRVLDENTLVVIVKEASL